MSNERNDDFHVVPDNAFEIRSDLEVRTTNNNESPSQVVPDIDPIAGDSADSSNIDSQTTDSRTIAIRNVFGIRSDLGARSGIRNDPSSSQVVSDIDANAGDTTSERPIRRRMGTTEPLLPMPSYCYDGYTREGRFVARFTAVDQLPEQVVPENEYVGPEQDIVRDLSKLALSGEKEGKVEKVSPTKRNLSPQKEPRPKKLFATRQNPEVRAYFERVRCAWETHTPVCRDNPLNLRTNDIPSGSQDPSRGPIQLQEDTGERVQSETASLGHRPSQDSTLIGETERRGLALEPAPSSSQISLAVGTRSRAQRELKLFRLLYGQKPSKTHPGSENTSGSLIELLGETGEVQSETASLGHQPSQDSTLSGETERRGLTLEPLPHLSLISLPEGTEPLTREELILELQTIANVYMNGIPPESIRERNVEEHLRPFQTSFLERFNGFNAALERALAGVRNLERSPHMNVFALSVISVNLIIALCDIDEVFEDFKVLLNQNSSSITVINRVHRRNCCLCYSSKFIFAIARYISAHQSDSTGATGTGP